MGRRLLPALALALTLALLAACGNQGAGGAAGGETTLYLYNWGDYIDPSLLEQFTEESGVTVVVDTFETNEDMIAKVRAGGSGYDIVVPSDYAVAVMSAEDLLAPLDKAQLSNLDNIDPELLGMYFDPENRYSVPYLYGTTGIAYSKAVFPDGVDSWGALFDPAQLEKVSGRASMLDDEREAPGAARSGR